MSDAQYGAIASADNLVNTILPIVGGIGIDYYGATWYVFHALGCERLLTPRASIICSILILVGGLVCCGGPVTGHFGLILAGRIIMGFGSTLIGSVQVRRYPTSDTMSDVLTSRTSSSRIGSLARTSPLSLHAISPGAASRPSSPAPPPCPSLR